MRPRWTPVLGLIPLLVAGCIGLPSEPATPPDVMTTHYPIQFLASELAGDDLDVDAFVHGSQPHGFEPTFQDRRAFAEATLVIHQGAGLDPWIHDLEQSAGGQAPRMLDLSQTVPLIVHGEDDVHEETAHDGEDEHAEDETHAEHEEDEAHPDHDEGIDPHTWLDPVRMADHARAVETVLAEIWPEHADGFQTRADRLVEQLERLHSSYETRLETCQTRTIVTSHNAFAYLADRYGITVASVHGLSADTEPSARTIDRLARTVETHNLTTVFFEELVDPAVVETIARETGAETAVLSPAAVLTDEQRDRGETYLTRMHANLDALADAMRCPPPEEA